MSRTRCFLAGFAIAAALMAPAIAGAHDGGTYNDGKRPKFAHAVGIKPYQLTGDQKMQFEFFASGFENRQRRVDGKRHVVPVAFFKFKLHTHFFAGTEVDISLRYLSHATEPRRVYLREWRERVPPSGDIELTEWSPMGMQVPAGRYMVEAWFFEKRQTPDVRRQLWAPRDANAEANMRAGRAYETAFFFMTPPCEYCKSTSQNEILVHGEAGDFKATATTDRQCKDEIELIDEQMTKACATWTSLVRSFERAAKGAKIEQVQFDDWHKAQRTALIELTATKAAQTAYRDGWLFARFPGAWGMVDSASDRILESAFALGLWVTWKAQTTNPALVAGRTPIEMPPGTADEIQRICGHSVEQASDDVRRIRSNMKAYFRALQRRVSVSESAGATGEPSAPASSREPAPPWWPTPVPTNPDGQILPVLPLDTPATVTSSPIPRQVDRATAAPAPAPSLAEPSPFEPLGVTVAALAVIALLLRAAVRR